MVIWREEVFGGTVASGQDGRGDLATGKLDREAVSSPEQEAARELPVGAEADGQLAASGASRTADRERVGGRPVVCRADAGG